MTTKSASPKHQNSYLFKALWGGTALKFWIPACSIEQAEKKAKKYVSKMEGGLTCIDLEFLRMK